MKICSVCGNKWREEADNGYCSWCKSEAVAIVIDKKSDKEELIESKVIPY